MESDNDYLEIVYGEDDESNDDDCKGWCKYLKELRTVAIGNAISTIFFMGPWVFFALCCYPIFWPFTILYIFWLYYDRKTPHRRGRKFPILRKLKCWQQTKRYFPIKMVKTAELPPDKNYLFASFPHGILCYGMGLNIVTDANDFDKAFPGLDPYVVTLNQGFFFPISRDVALALGICASSAQSITRILNGPPGTVCVVVVGGVAEMIHSTPGVNRLFLRNRKGFVKLALKTGASLVPVFSFGETNTFYQPKFKLYKILQDKWRSTIRAPLMILNGRGLFQNYAGCLPYRTPITTIIGKPIDVPKLDDPTDDDVDKYHTKFISELEKLFNHFKGKYDLKGEDAVLEIE